MKSESPTAGSKPGKDQAPAGPSWSEEDRLAALAGYAILDTPREPEFDDIARLAADVFEAPIAVVNLIASGRQWFKAEVGIGVDEMPLDVSICAHAILQPGIFVVPDTREDNRFACNPLVTGAPGLRFYAGALLETPHGLPLGTVCVLDTKPRPDGITDRQRLTLEVLARQVMIQLELRRAVAERDQQAERLRQEIAVRSDVDQELKETDRRLNAVLNNTRMAVFLIDDRQHCAYSNAAAEALTGYTFQEMKGRPLHDVIHHKKPDGSHYPIEECPIDRAFPKRAQMSGEELFVARDGSFYPVAFTASPLIDDDGVPTGTVIEARDISHEKARDAALRELHENLERRVDEALAERKLWVDVFENTDALIGALDLDRRFLAFNEAYAAEFERIFGLRPTRGESLAALLESQPEHRGAALAIWDRALAGESFTVTEPFGDAERARPYYELRFNPLHDERGRIIGAFQYAVDVTERLRSEARLAETEEALRQSQKMEAIGQLSAGVAHDFNNMLSIVIGSLDLAKRKASESESNTLRLIDNALEGANRAATLTHRLLAFSRQQPLQPRPLDVNKLAAGMSELLRRTIGEGIRLETVQSGGLWRVHADPHQLENAILNLAVNARDAMPEGGRLTIETANAHLDDAYARKHLGVQPGQYVQIAVTDSGEGMSPDIVAKVFEPFFTTKSIGKGTGLGLSMIYGFVKQSGGHIRIYSEVGRGTTVKLYLPRYAGAEQEIADSQNIAAAAPGGGRKEIILVVEDEEDVRRMSVEALRDLGYTVIEAGHADEAIRVLEQNAGITLLFTDVVMPERTGRDLADEALRRWPDLKLLYTTGYTRNAVVHNGTLDQGVQFISKPFTIAQLATKVREVLDGILTAEPSG